MSAQLADIQIEQGASFSAGLEFNDANNAPIDVSGWDFRAQVRAKYDATVILATFTFTAGDATNKVNMSLTAVDTAAIPVDKALSYKLPATKYAYDVEATRGDSSVIRILQGTALISPDVTR